LLHIALKLAKTKKWLSTYLQNMFKSYEVRGQNHRSTRKPETVHMHYGKVRTIASSK